MRLVLPVDALKSSDVVAAFGRLTSRHEHPAQFRLPTVSTVVPLTITLILSLPENPAVRAQ